jgi:hypothetical protein
MDEALAEWLALREPADAACRSASLTQALADGMGVRDTLRVLDLATGTGSSIRYLMDRFPVRHQHWLAVDRSPVLLAQLPIGMSLWGADRGYEVERNAAGCAITGPRWVCHVETRTRDLGTLDADLFANRHVVTASALLDLVSESWVRALAARCRAAGAAALFTITYNGRSSCSPPEPEDALVLDLFNRHQRTDKGLGGPAAGPDAAGCAVRAFTECGYHVRSEPSDWTLGSEAAQLQRQLIDGWASAAAEMEPDAASTIEGWRIRRIGYLDAGRSHLLVGHDDVAAWRPESR